MPPKDHIEINPFQMARMFWPYLYYKTHADWPEIAQTLADNRARSNSLREAADHATGSVNLVDAFNLFSIVKYFGFSTVIEVGTYIGNSTLAMAYAMDANKLGGRIFTCDVTNDIELPNPFGHVEIVQYRKQSSEEMLTQLAASGVVCDFLYLDGRIPDSEIGLIESVTHEHTVVAVDDFEGIEKGVENMLKLKPMPRFARHFIIYPPTNDIFRELPLGQSPIQRSQTAVLFPASRISFTRQ